MGSKDKVIASIAMNFPKADHFYDLFGGGFSVSHFMVTNKRKKYKHFHYNEIKSDIVELVKKAINGNFNYDRFKPPWVSRETFFKNLNDPYIRICWSFGNDQKSYMFSKEIEPYKKSMHMAVVFDEFDHLAKEVFKFEKWPSNVKSINHKRLYLRQLIEFYRINNKLPQVLYPFLPAKQFDHLRRLQKLQRLEPLERLHQLQQLERFSPLKNYLTFSSKDYQDVEILPNSVVYCDIPYKGTADYANSFDYKRFFDWAKTRNFPVFISEYNVDDPDFKLVYTIDKRSMLSSDKSKCKDKQEKLYWNGVQSP